jgi:hypothetical protein
MAAAAGQVPQALRGCRTSPERAAGAAPARAIVLRGVPRRAAGQDGARRVEQQRCPEVRAQQWLGGGIQQLPECLQFSLSGECSLGPPVAGP